MEPELELTIPLKAELTKTCITFARISNMLGITVRGNFNGKTLMAQPGERAEEVEETYKKRK